MDFVGYTKQCYYGTYRTNIATIVLPSTQVHCLGRILIFWLLSFTGKKIKERFRTDIPEITLKRVGVSYSPLYSLSPDYTIGRSCRTDPAPFRFPPNTCYKSIVPLQGFEPCFVLRLFNQIYTPYTKWRVPSAANGDFRCLEITPEKRGYAFLNRLKTNS